MNLFCSHCPNLAGNQQCADAFKRIWKSPIFCGLDPTSFSANREKRRMGIPFVHQGSAHTKAMCTKAVRRRKTGWDWLEKFARSNLTYVCFFQWNFSFNHFVVQPGQSYQVTVHHLPKLSTDGDQNSINQSYTVPGKKPCNVGHDLLMWAYFTSWCTVGLGLDPEVPG